MRKHLCWLLLSILGGCGDLQDDDVAASESALVEAGSGARATTTLATGLIHGCAITALGDVMCWGANHYGQLGFPADPGVYTPRVVPGVSSAVAIAAGDYHTCAVLAGGSVRCWGANNAGQVGNGSTGASAAPTTVPGLTWVKEVVAGAFHTCALRGNGTAFCWGYGPIGGNQTGDPYQLVPAQVALYTDFKQLASGQQHMCGLRGNGEVKCWGDNDEGQLGTGNYNSYSAPQGVPWMIDIRQIAAGEDHTCVLSESGRVNCWGNNDYGQLGDGTTTSRLSPTQVPGLVDIGYLGAGSRTTCAIDTSAGLTKCWGRNEYGELGIGTTTGPQSSPVTVSSLSGAVEVAGGEAHNCAVTGAAQVKCWGESYYGQTGNGRIVAPVTVPALVPLGTFARSTVSIAVEEKIVLARPDGTNRAWEWTAGATAAQTPSMFSPPRLVATTSSHSCAITASGVVRCWGENSVGQLGNNTFTDNPSPQQVHNLTDAVHLDVGNGTSCAVRTTGSVHCWGSGWAYRLGIGDSADSATPVTAVGLENLATQVAVAYQTVCALLVDGRVTCWGAGSTGSAGDPDKITASPTEPLGVPAIALSGGAAATGDDGFCALLANGQVKCWGRNPGNGTAYSAVPATVSLSYPAVSVDKSADNGCVVLATGSIRCWGRNDEGQVGNGTVGASVLSPVPISVSNAVAVAVGGNGKRNACAVTASGSVYCWGRGFGPSPVLQTLP